ncbi:MAG: hypothetical protein WA885_06285 [Phormidesmis sp.]
MTTRVSLLLASLSVFIAGAPATAATFTYEVSDVGGKTAAGFIKAISTTFDTDTDLFTWSSTFSRNPATNGLAEGGWLVISDGPNPEPSDEYAIFYYDSTTRDQVTIYNYDDIDRGAHSWRNSTLLDTTGLTITDSGDERTFDFSFDMTDINAMTDTFGPDWEGTSFGEEIGIWFHGLDGLTTAYAPNGSLTEFKFEKESWFDIKNAPTGSVSQAVPEPAGTAALGMFAGSMLMASAYRRRKQSAAIETETVEA